MTLLRPARLLGAAGLVVALAATLGTANAAPAPTPTAGPPAGSPAAAPPAGSPAAPPDTSCPTGDGITVTGSIAEDLDGADGHRQLLPGSGSFGVGCSPNEEPDDGWDGRGIPAPPDVDPAADDEGDPFDRQNGLYLGYQFDLTGGGLPDYWEQPIAFRPSNAELIASAWSGSDGLAYTMTEYGWTESGAQDERQTVEGMLPAGPECRWHGPVAAQDMPARLADYARGGRPVYKYDHVPMRIGSRKFAHAPGGWFHYLCGAATPSSITGPLPGSKLSAVEADYYLTPHWVYAEGVDAGQLTTVARIVRAARARVTATVDTSPVDRSVVNLKTWMWSDARRYVFVLGGQRAEVVPTGIRVVAPGVPLVAHDVRSGGCRTGGVPDTGDARADTDCYFRFTKANTTDPSDVYQVGFALRWQVRVAGVPPLTFWTTRVQNFKVGEVQVPSDRLPGQQS
jgi:hypothetical protein